MIYVDNAYIPAKVGRYDSKWCHLLSDEKDPESLHLFAESIGLKRSYFQPGKFCWWHQHYDLTLGKLKLAVSKGAVEIGIRQWMDIVNGLKNV